MPARGGEVALGTCAMKGQRPMMLMMPDDLLQVRAPGLNFYVLKDRAGLYLLDAGFVGGRFLLRRALRQRGWQDEPIRGIIVTHGLLDHILNVASLAQTADAWIAAPRLDADYYVGRPAYHSWAKVTGILESVARPLLGFRTVRPDRWIDDGGFLDVWQGLRAVHLPGHTEGHTGYYCERLKLLFTADLFASYRGWAHFPPDIFNSTPNDLPKSAATALALDLAGVIPNHADRSSSAEHLLRLRRLQERTAQRAGANRGC